MNEKCQKCFELHRLDCSGVSKDKEPDCYLYRNNKED